MTLKFVKVKNGQEEEIASMIVKNTDSLEELEVIIYDPGAGELGIGEIFKGWSLDKKNYTIEDAEAESSATHPKNIEDIRQWALNQEPSITEGDTHTFYAMIFQAHTVAYRDEDGATISGETLIFNAGEGYAAYKVNESYTPKTQDQDFEGWYWSPVHAGQTDLVKDKDGNIISSNTPIPNLTDVQIYGDVIFTPYAPTGKWVIFNQNGDGASYTPPQFVLTNGKAEEPDDPTRLGYTFAGWYEAQGYDVDGNPIKDEDGNVLLKDTAFDFNTTITERTRLYAKWTPAARANYTVIVWKEKAGDTYAENVGDGKTRNYDYWKSYTLTGNVGDVINAVSNSTSQTEDINGSYYDVQVSGTRAEGGNVNEVVSETGYHTARYDQNVEITPEGTAIVNVYYDRHAVRYTFYYPYGEIYTYEPVPSSTTTSGTYYVSDGSGGYEAIYLYRNGGKWYQNRETVYDYAISQSTNTGYYYIPNDDGGYDRVYLYRNGGKWYQDRDTEYGYYESQSTDNGYYYIPNGYGGYNIVYLYRYNGKWWRTRSGGWLTPVVYSDEYVGPVYEYGSHYEYSNEYDGDVYTQTTRYEYSNEYTDTVYSRTTRNDWQQYQQEVGLYGETLNWPTDTSIAWYEGHNGSQTTGSRMTYKSSFLPNGTNMNVEYWGRAATGGGTVKFLTQDITGGDSYTSKMTVRVSAVGDPGVGSVSFSINDKFTGFQAYQYRYRETANGRWTGWQNVGAYNPSSGIYGSAINYGHDLEIRYKRLSGTIAFMDGAYYSGNGVRIEDKPSQGKISETDPYFYEASLSSYNSDGADYYVPETIPEGFVFGGWYADAPCTVPYNFTTMPATGVTVYAKWVQKQYRVFMYPNVPESDSSLDWGNQQMSYRVDYGEKPAGGKTIVGIRDDYEFIGWYLDEGLTKPYNFEAYELRDDTKDLTGKDLLKDYDKTQSTELNKWGNPTEDTNKDATNNRYWINKKLELYGKWRAKLNGARGIKVEFDAVQGKGYFPVEGSTETRIIHSDGLYYLDRSEAVATSSPTAASETEQFIYWVVQTWNPETGKYEDVPGKVVYPGESFEVLKDYAKEEEMSPGEEDYDEDTNHKRLTVRLRAEYGPREALTPTHIHWYANNDSEYSAACETSDTDYMVRSLGKEGKDHLEINEAVLIKPANTFSYEGHKFIGWARLTEPAGATTVERDDHPELTADDLFLKYDEEHNRFLAEITDANGRTSWQPVTQVAADEVTPYHDLYAVWEKEKYDVDIRKIVAGADEDEDWDTSRTFNISYSYQDEDQTTKSGSVDLHHKETTSKDTGKPQTIQNVPYGTIITVTEEGEPEYDKEYSATHEVIEEGQEDPQDVPFEPEKDKDGKSLVNKFKVTSNTTVTVTNSRKVQNIIVKKTDVVNNELLLGGAKFTISKYELTTAEDGDKKGYTEAVELNVGQYDLTETVAPDGYNPPSEPVSVKVTGSGVTYIQPDSHGGAPQTAEKDSDGNYVIVVTNSTGQELPMTGGIGTTIFYILGSLLVIGCGIVLVARRRTGTGR